MDLLLNLLSIVAFKTLLYLNSGGRLLWNAPSDEEVMLKRSIRIMTAINSFVILSKRYIFRSHTAHIFHLISQKAPTPSSISHIITLCSTMCIFNTQSLSSSTLHLVSKDHEGHDRPLVQPPVNLLKIADSISSWYIDREKKAAYYYVLNDFSK